jgi:hypothetical protein
MERVPTHRGMIGAAVALICVSACGTSRVVDSEEEAAPTVGRGTREDPPPGIPPLGSSSGSSSGGALPGCPSTRGDEPPTDPLTEDDVLGAIGIYRPCTEPEGLELRLDGPGKLHWYRLDERFVRIQAWEGTVEVGSCEAHSCAVSWTDRGLGTRTYQIDLWRDPVALRLQATGELAQEWVRVAE